MDVTRLSASTAAAPGSDRTKARASVDSTTDAFQKADKRINQQRESVNVQLSSFGKLKSSLAETQSASRELSDSKRSATDTDLKSTANNFVQAFNTATQTARSTAAQLGTSPQSHRARATETDLRRAVSSDTTVTSDLKKVGITQQKDGSLAIDTKKFDAALKTDPDSLRGTLSKIGQQVDRTATSELADRGNVGSSLSSLSNRARSLENTQDAQQSQAAAAQQVVRTQTARLNNNLNSGAAAYQRIFSI
jgi:hypothetical protein